jgi:tRNA (guanine9-N1)-methyltransferase
MDGQDAPLCNVDATESKAEACTGDNGADCSAPQLSKNAAKRLARKAKREETRAQWKARLRQKDAERRERRKAAAASANGNSGSDTLDGGAVNGAPPQRKTQQPASGEIVIDLGYNELMNEKEVLSLVVQICRAYSTIRRAERPFRLVLCGVSGAVRDELVRMYPDHVRWACDLHTAPLGDYAAGRSLVYLSADSDSVLETVNDYSALIIGGLVDKNRHKGVAHSRAAQLGIPTARLPLAEHVQLHASPVLTVVNVVEMLCRVRDGAAWADAILATVPCRKRNNCNE